MCINGRVVATRSETIILICRFYVCGVKAFLNPVWILINVVNEHITLDRHIHLLWFNLIALYRGGSRIFKRGGGGTNYRRREFFRGVWGHASPEMFENLEESLKWPFPAFWDTFRTRLILIFASKLRFCKKTQNKTKKKSKKGGQGPQPPPLFGSATALSTCSLYKESTNAI